MRQFIGKLFGGKQKGENIVIVSGLPRSGTSMMMKMLEAGGIPPLTDEIRSADDDNPKGYYEFERVKKLDKGDVAWLEDANGKVVKVISALLKHLPDTYTYKVVFLRRHTHEILASQRKMLANRGEDSSAATDDQMARMFERHLTDIGRWFADQPHVEVTYVHYSDVLADPQSQAEQVAAFLQMKLDIEAMTSVVDPALYRNRRL